MKLDTITFKCKKCGADVTISTDIKGLCAGKLCVWCTQKKKGEAR